MSGHTWEDIIVQIRKDPAYKDLVRDAYFEEELPLNVERFRSSAEFLETVKLLGHHMTVGKGLRVLDVGAGNGISSAAFALLGCEVIAVEPDPSATVGSNAIRKLKAHYALPNLDVVDSFGESIPQPAASFDLVYIRQAMHHAADLDAFIREAARLLKPGGFLLTVRDHVVFDEADKKWFLETHPLHKFYGGENAFSEREYREAFRKAGLEIRESFRYYESVINFFPQAEATVKGKRAQFEQQVDNGMRKFGPLKHLSFLRARYSRYLAEKYGHPLDEKKVPGRMYTFLAQKK